MSDRLLAITVIGRAVEDLQLKQGQDFRSAYLFLHSEQEAWAELRRMWCGIAGVEQGWIRRKLKEIQSSEKRILHGRHRRNTTKS